MMYDFKLMQDEELQAIQAIYMDDYVNNTQDDNPPEITLRLTPLQSVTGKEIHAKVDLLIKCTSNYPQDPPILKLENAKGLSNEDLSKLKGDLDKMALMLCGEVMILQLAHYIQSTLHQYNVPNLSFFEQMLANQQKQVEMSIKEKQMKHEAQIAEDKEKDEDVMRQVKEELIKREEVLKQERRKRQSSNSFNSPSNSSASLIVADEQHKPVFVCLLSKGRKLSVYTFRHKQEEKKFFCSSCVGHYFENACLLSAIEEGTGKVMSLCEWKINLSAEKRKVHFKDNLEKAAETDSVLKQIQSVEHEFNYLKSKICFNGLLNYHGFSIERIGNTLFVKLLLDSVTGPPLSTFLQGGGVSISFLQHITKQLVSVLQYLHGKSVVHKDLNLCNTFLNSNNEIVIAGYSVMRRISDICEQCNIETCDSHPRQFKTYRTFVKVGKKGDVFNLGLILFCLHQGKVPSEYPLIIPNALPPHFRDFLESCLSSDEEKRSSVEILSKHPFMHEKLYNVQSFHSNDISFDLRLNEPINQTGVMSMPFLRHHSVLFKSRLTNEFDVETMEMLGKGGFGSVIKIRNKLDHNWYAIKRIPLNPNSPHLNKRITREVQLLSRLNHENVVRYFNSWIEAEDIQLLGNNTSEDTDFTSTSPLRHKSKQQKEFQPKLKRNMEESLLQLNNFEETDGVIFNESVDISWGDEPSIRERDKSSSSSSSSLTEGKRSDSKFGNRSYSWRSMKPTHDSSEGIVFQMDDSVLQFGDMLDSDDEEFEDNIIEGIETTATIPTVSFDSYQETPLQYLYIQMEYCEKSTLRNVIDEGLYKEPERVWRYFREIVEGLAHVHGQGIIHRDLKPVNIFMDMYNRIKIGDFGLATSHSSNLDSTMLLQDNDSLHSNTDDNMTGKVGTALYVAPELCLSNTRIKFSQKVDVYSLGIILFEMCYRPLNTGMERVKTLGLLRTEDKIFPTDFNTKKNSRDQFVISWLLNHDPNGRPTATELLESGYVPPKIEDSQLDELLKHTLSQTNSSRYQRLMTTLFTQPVTPVYDQIYDNKLHDKSEIQVVEGARILQYVRSIVRRIFLKHGAVFVEVPLLIPKTKVFDKFRNVVSFIDQSGLQLCLPYDSKISFARFISRNKICNLKRFYFGKLYRTAKVLAAHPFGIWECSYDIVTDACNSVLPIAELIYTVAEIIQEFPALSNKNFYIRLNHLNLIKSIFLQHNFNEDTQKKIYEILEVTKNQNQREELLCGLFTDLKLSEHIVNKLLLFLTFEGSVTKAKETLQVLRKSKAAVSSLAKEAFQDIDQLIKHLENFNIDFPVHISMFYVTNVEHYSGLIFQFVAANTRKKKRGGVDILAAGGCYNQLVESMRKYTGSKIATSSYGVSVAVEKLLLAAVEEKETNETIPQYCSECDVIVCSVTTAPSLDVLVQVLHELWSTNISASLFSYESNQDYTVEEIQDYCFDHGVNHLVLLKDTDLEYTRVRSKEKDKFIECRILRQDLCDYLTQKISPKSDYVKDLSEQLSKAPTTFFQQSEPSFMFTFVSLDKIEANKKNLFRKIFLSKFQHQLQQMFGANDLQIVAAKLGKSELRLVVAYLELSSSYDDFETSLRGIMDMYKEQGSFLKRVCNTLYQVYTESQSVVILYSYVAEIYKVLS